MTLRPETLLLLDDEALRAAVAWPDVARSGEARDGWMEQDGLWFDFEQWRALADLGVMAMERQAYRLLDAGLLGPDGSVDPTVTAMAKKAVINRMKRL